LGPVFFGALMHKHVFALSIVAATIAGCPAPAPPVVVQIAAPAPATAAPEPAPLPSAAKAEGGDRAPPISLERVAGSGPRSLAEASGKVVILAFCATFAAPCRMSLPAFQVIAAAHPGEVVVIAVMEDSDDDPAMARQIKDYAGDLKVDFSFLWD